MEQVMGLISKASALITFVFISTFINEKINQNRWKKEVHAILQGLVFCAFIFVDMKTPFIDSVQINYDAREVLMNLSAVTYGPITATITAGFSFLVRTYRYSKGTETALAGIALIYVVEMLFLLVFHLKKWKFNHRSVLLLSIISNIISGIAIMMIMEEKISETILLIITLVISYPIITLITYQIMSHIKYREELVLKLSESDKILNQKNTELKHRNHDLEQAELQFRTLFNHSSEMVFLIENEVVSDVNYAAVEALGYCRKEDLIGKSFLKLMPDSQKKEPSALLWQNILKVIGGGEPARSEFSLLNMSGIEFLIEGIFVQVEMMERKFVYLSARDIRERKRQEEEILFKAQYDALTKVANRQYFNERLRAVIEEEKNYPIAFVIADIDGLKLTNDIFGHSKGDELIVSVAEVLSASCRSKDLVARIGGDEFAMIFPNNDQASIQKVVERIKSNLEKRRVETISPSVSLGFVIKESKEEEMEVLLKKADTMMYEIKSQQRQPNAKKFLDNLSEKLYQISPISKQVHRDLLIMSKNLLQKNHIAISTERELDRMVRYYEFGKLTCPQEAWKVEVEDDTLRFSEKMLERSYATLRVIGEIDALSVSKLIFALNEDWNGKGPLGMKGDEIALSVRVFQIIHDYYILSHFYKERFSGENTVLKWMNQQVGKKYDPTLWKEFLITLE